MFVVVINPTSGNGKGGKVWNKVKPLLEKKGISFEAYVSKEKGDISRFVAKLDRADKLIVIGGDGTLHEVLNGLSKNHEIAIGYIPAGSGNDFARSLNIPLAYEKALECILRGEEKKLDVLKVGEHVCATIVGAGFDGFVVEQSNKWVLKKWLNKLGLGKISYLLTVILAVFQYRPCQIELTVDGVTERFSNVWLVAVGNLPYYGGGMKICPKAVGDDGQLDICVVSNLSSISLLSFFPNVFLGKHIALTSKVATRKGRQISIAASTPTIVQGDGEILTAAPVGISIIDKSLTLLR